MPKTKKIRVECSICKATLTLELPMNITENRDYYPFEYIHIHGEPEHAIMIFLDKNLAVRDSMVYKDLNTARKTAKEIKTLLRSSQEELLASIYNDPLRIKILELLRNGPLTEDALVEALNHEPKFEEQMFNYLMLPFLKLHLIQSSWLNETFFEGYFLIKDFVVFRKPSEENIKFLTENKLLAKLKELYVPFVQNYYQEYYKLYLLNNDAKLKDIQICLNILSDLNSDRVIRQLKKGPITRNEIFDLAPLNVIDQLLKNNIIMKINVKIDEYYILLGEIVVKYFTPEYLLKTIENKYKQKEISYEMASKHLDLLYENELH